MARKRHKKNRTSVQQTFCVDGSFKGFLTGVSKFILGLFTRGVILAVLHSEGFASFLASIYDIWYFFTGGNSGKE